MAELDAEHAHDQEIGGLLVSERSGIATIRRRSARPAFGVPRRFGIGTLLIVTAAYGALLTVLRAMDWHRGAIAACLGFISLIGLGQMLLFRAQQPRKASIVTGAVCVPLVQLLIVLSRDGREWFDPQGWLDAATTLGWILLLIPHGAIAGYLAGGIVAGVFLIMDTVERAIGNKRASAV